MAGCVTLAKLVLSSISTHTMYCFNLPAKTSEIINKIVRDFILGSCKDKGKIHLVICQIITPPKKNGGLQIRDAILQNKALLASLAWRFLTSNQNTPWISVLATKYLSNQSKHPFQIPKKKT